MNAEFDTTAYLEQIFEELNFDGLESFSVDFLPGKMGFGEMVEQLLWEKSISWSDVVAMVGQCFFYELQNAKTILIGVLFLAIGYTVFGRYLQGEKKQMNDITYLAVYGALVLILMESLLLISRVAAEGVEALQQYLTALIPAYATTLALSGNLTSGACFYELTFGILWVEEWVMADLILPAIHLMVLLALLNHLGVGEPLGGYVGMIESAVKWGMKILTTAVVGVGSVEALLAPARDQIAENTVLKSLSILPGLGGGFEFAEEVIWSCGALVKNCVGIAGVIFLVLVGLSPIITIFAYFFLYRLLAAMLGPIADHKMIECMFDMSRAAWLLLKVMANTILWFLLSILMVTASTSFMG